jgi:hypothetical protein
LDVLDFGVLHRGGCARVVEAWCHAHSHRCVTHRFPCDLSYLVNLSEGWIQRTGDLEYFYDLVNLRDFLWFGEC